MDEPMIKFIALIGICLVYSIIILLLVLANQNKDKEIDKIGNKYRDLKRFFYRYQMAAFNCSRIEDPGTRSRHMQNLQTEYMEELDNNH